ncbi:deoxyribodipyrimidine photo-lyase [Synechococcus sp. J7-Johnson]|uniref:FAD-binding domain-containing protein n=1 Tax=Synechococcus sp. J7-Johnson TaxID=2823737 RepID=UPI0020CC0BC0|nr:FAD-binding domain-containing protein [Synechococcus sp. J7-Johnson]MCP9841564.1 deoxyribodipyrimidine photo-lyase [Synechococcus sp. J7-Johnson]
MTSRTPPSEPAPPPQTNRADLPRQFPDRGAMVQDLAARFPLASGGASPIRGGSKPALAALEAVDPVRYAASRNHLGGAVSGLSPYIRHGVLSLAQVRDVVLERMARGPGLVSEKLLQELAWRDYWQRLWIRLGDGIWENLEPLKTGQAEAAYAQELPDDISEGHTGLACIDAFARQLIDTGWLHNHARMWLAAYVVHWRRVRWQAGARWFLRHLLDGDAASNNLSWQWVASSFSSKPYLFNRANLERFGAGRHCLGCPAAEDCPFEASYEDLQTRLFSAPQGGGQASGEQGKGGAV